MKKSSSRSQRGSKGIKSKHIFQICVLLGVCIWLIYQVKYSHDKKKEFFEKDVKKSESEDRLVKLGRKDLLPGYHKEKEKHVEEDDDDEEEKESKSKVEEDEKEDEEEKESKSKVEEDEKEDEEEKESKSKVEEEEKEDEEEGVEEDEEDKNKQGEEVDEEENKHEEDIDEQEDQSKTELLEEEKGIGSNESDMTVEEAREEHYKADDASSAVSHESRVTAQEKDFNATTSEVEIQKEPVLKFGDAAETTREVKDSNETRSTVTESVNGNSTVLEILQNETEIMRDRSEKDGESDLKTVLEHESDPNISVSVNTTNKDSIQDDSRNSTSESSILENISSSNSRSEGDDESDEKESSQTLHEEAEDTSENSVSQAEMEALTDTQTLPDIRTEGNEEDEEEAIAEE